MIKDNKYYAIKYKSGLDIIKKMGVVTREQAVKLLGCHNDTLNVLCSLQLIKLLKISRYDLYSIASDKEYHNRQIRRSVLLTQFYLDKKENIIIDYNKSIENSLRQQNVLYLSYTSKHNINHYLILGVNEKSYAEKGDYLQLVKLCKDIYFNDSINRVRIYFFHNYNNFDYDQFLDYLHRDREIGCLDMQSDSILSVKNVITNIPVLRCI